MTDQPFQFQIDHIDPLGQGIDKNHGEITFIAKTLPGETGTAHICKTKKGVQFAKLIALESSSEKRTPPECPHFQDCPGCDYLHTDYETELGFKKSALVKTFQKIAFDMAKLEIISAPRRTGYRNRMQLHYRENKLGLVDGLIDRIVEIPDCIIAGDALRAALKRLYEDKNRQEKHSGSGHCELYFHHGELKIEWNRPYAHGGFSQVNDEMNAVLRRAVRESLKATVVSSILDLFAGGGNLSDDLVKAHAATRVMVDVPPAKRHPDLIHLDLYPLSALKIFERKSPLKRFDLILLDPPRKGFPALNTWVERYRPKTLIYVSCHPGTLARDLGRLKPVHEISNLVLIDLFPSTRHFETLAHIRFRD